MSLDDLEEWRYHLISPSDALRDLPLVTVGDETARGVCHGMRFVGGDITAGPDEEPFRVVDENGSLLAVYAKVGREARPEVVLPS